MIRATLATLAAALIALALGHTALITALTFPETLAQAEALKGM